MKKDKLKELFEANEVKNLHHLVGGQGNDSKSSEDTNTLHTSGDIGSCDTDTSVTYDTRVVEDDPFAPFISSSDMTGP